MPEFIFAYHGGTKPESPEQGQEMMKKWQAWITDLGDTMVNPGSPVGMSKTVSASGVADNGGSNPLGGFSIVKAENIEAAIAMAKKSPFLDIEGTIEVAEIMKM